MSAVRVCACAFELWPPARHTTDGPAGPLTEPYNVPEFVSLDQLLRVGCTSFDIKSQPQPRVEQAPGQASTFKPALSSCKTAFQGRLSSTGFKSATDSSKGKGASGSAGRRSTLPPDSALADAGETELPSRATQVEATASQISVYISQAGLEVKRHQRDIDKYQLEIARSLKAAHRKGQQPSEGERQAPHETHLRYLKWWRDAAVQKEEGLRIALQRMQEACANGVPVDATLSGVLSVAVKQAALLAARSPAAQNSGPRVIRELKGSIIDPLELRELRERSDDERRRSDILLPARIIRRLQDVVPHEKRQVGLMNRIQQIFVSDWALSFAPEKRAAVRRFVRAVQGRSSPDIIQRNPLEDPTAACNPLDLDILVSQILSPVLDSRDVLEALSALLQVIVEVVPADVAQQAPLLRHNVIATLLLSSSTPELAVPWLLDVPEPPAAERAGYIDTYRLLAATTTLDWPSFRRVTEALLANQALCDVNSLARVVFLQGLVLRYDAVPNFVEAFDWGFSAFVKAGLATSDPKLALRVSAGYADNIGAHELKLRLESKLEIVEANDFKRRRAGSTLDGVGPQRVDGPAATVNNPPLPLVSDSQVVKKYSVALDPILLEQVVSSTDETAALLSRVVPPRVIAQDVWLSSFGATFQSLNDVWRRLRPQRTPPPKPALAQPGESKSTSAPASLPLPSPPLVVSSPRYVKSRAAWTMAATVKHRTSSSPSPVPAGTKPLTPPQPPPQMDPKLSPPHLERKRPVIQPVVKRPSPSALKALASGSKTGRR